MDNFTSVRALRNKEVVNLCDGRRLGYIVDLEIDVLCARVLAIVVCLEDGKLFSFGKCQEIVIPWDRIECFGDDVILVNVLVEDCRRADCPKNTKDTNNC